MDITQLVVLSIRYAAIKKTSMALLNTLILETRTKYEPEEFGDLISELGNLDNYGKPQPIIYYEKGIPEIDSLFGDKTYYQEGYVSNLLAVENCFGIVFSKYKNEEIVDAGGLYISREDIIEFKEYDCDNLEIIKNQEIKERMNYMWKKGGGIIGGLSGSLTDKMITYKTDLVQGSKFELSFYNKLNEVQTVFLYVSNDFFQDAFLFIKTYYKQELPIEAKQSTASSNNNCFIATACYKDTFAPEVIFFRKYRDLELSKYFLGRLFIRFYYKFSPYLYKPLFNRPKTALRLKRILDKLYLYLKE
jgi:hypothetical protein